MTRTTIDIDDAACASVMRRYRIASKRDAVNFALQTLVHAPLDLAAARELEGSGWDGDLTELRASQLRHEQLPDTGS
jgi:Arc/MetJ family transcription regulator